MEGQPAAEALKQLEAMQLPKDSRVTELRRQLVERLRLCSEYPQHFERLEEEHSFAEQLEQRSGILRSAGLTTDINGNAIAYPSYEEQRAKMLQRPELLAKMNQGFVRLQPVPIGAPLSRYFSALEDGLRQYAKENRLRATDGTVLQLDADKSLWKWDAYDEADTNGSLVYEPKKLTTEDHGGMTKTQLIEERGPMQVLLTENLREFPRAGIGETIGDRPQIEAGKTPEQYAEMFGKVPYELETPYALETQLAHLLTHLHETEGELIDNYESNCSSAVYCSAGWFPEAEMVPFVCFYRFKGQYCVTKAPLSCNFPIVGVRCAVRVS